MHKKEDCKSANNQGKNTTYNPEIIAKTLDKKCKYHPDEYCNLIYLTNATSEHRICQVCAKKKQLPSQHLISISALFSDDNSSFVLSGCPMIEDPFVTNKRNRSVESIRAQKEEIQQFYNNLLQNCQQMLEKSMKEDLLALDSLDTLYYENATDSLIDSKFVLDLQEIFLSDESEVDILLKALLERTCSNKRAKKQANCEVKELYEILQEQYSLNSVNKISQSILELLEQLHIFSKEFISQTGFIPSIPQINQSVKTTTSLLPEIQLISYDNQYSNKQNATIIKEANGTFLITHNRTQYNTCAVCRISSKLLKNLNYIIRLQLLHNIDDEKPYFQFCLLPKNVQLNQFLEEASFGYDELTGGFIDKVVKGKEVFSGRTNIGTQKQLEFRINIDKQYFRIADYPNYENVARLAEDDKFLMGEQYDYYFEIYIDKPPNSVRLLDFSIASQFDDKMN